jgi:hypothetical protein
MVLQHRGSEEVRCTANQIYGAWRNDSPRRGVSTAAASTPARWRLPGDLDRTIGKDGVGRGASR